MITAIVVIVVGLALLVWSADRFVDGASGIAKNFQVPPMIIGLTIVSLCTSLPEMLVSSIAAWNGNGDLGIGNAIGSNIANIGLVLGSTALIAPLAVHSKLIKREMPVLMTVSVLALALMLDGELSFIDGLILFFGMLAVVYWLYRTGISERDAVLEAEFEEELSEEMSMNQAIGYLLLGVVVLMISSRMVVWGAVEVATLLGVSDLVIGLTIVAIGTSLPELVASIVSVLKQESDLAIGNVIGSNMFNTLGVLMMPALIAPGTFDAATLNRDLPVMFGFTVLLWLMAFGFKKAAVITRLKGALLASGFVAYLYTLYLQSI